MTQPLLRPRWLKKQIITAVDNSGRDTGPYLVRWAINTPLGGVKLHCFLRSDEDRDLHDHPWSFVSIILWGGYWEWRPCDCSACEWHDIKSRRLIRTWRRPGSILWRPAPSPHRVELPEQADGTPRRAWTVVLTSPKRREWGFHTVCGFVPWFRYSAAKEEGC